MDSQKKIKINKRMDNNKFNESLLRTKSEIILLISILLDKNNIFFLDLLYTINLRRDILRHVYKPSLKH